VPEGLSKNIIKVVV